MPWSIQKMSTLEDEELVRRIASGKDAAFTELYQRYHLRLFNFFLKMHGHDRAKAEDLLQETFLKVVRHAHTFRSKGQFSSWVFTIAGNLCKNEYRQKAVRKGVERLEDWENLTEHQPDTQSPIQELLSEELMEAISKFTEALDTMYRATFLLRYQENLSIAEISTILDCAEGTTKSRLFHLHKKLAKHLALYHPSGKEK